MASITIFDGANTIDGTKIFIEEKLKPEFIKGFYVSEYASKSDLTHVIEIIDVDYIIRVHTENPNWFKEHFDNVNLLKN